MITSTGAPSARCTTAVSENRRKSSSEFSRNRYPSCSKSASTPVRSRKFRISSIEYRDSATFAAVVNCNRTPPAAFAVDPVPSASSRSKTTTLPTFRSARWAAIEAPITPPPTMATSAKRSRPITLRPPGFVATLSIPQWVSRLAPDKIARP